MPVDVRLASRDEVADVAAVLARSFFHDRIYRWLVPDDEQRRRSAERFFAIFADACWAHGGVHMAAEGAGAALWLPSGQELVSEEHAEEFGRSLLETAGDEGAATRMQALIAAEDAHHPPEPSWYLPFIGVDPGRQGAGVGSALLAAALERVDAEGLPAYLEASCPENQRLYERHGFVTTGEIAVLDAPAVYPMWREPRR